MHTLFKAEELIRGFKNLKSDILIEDFTIGNDNIMYGDRYFSSRVEMSEPFFKLYISVYEQVLSFEWSLEDLNSFKFKKAITDGIGKAIKSECTRKGLVK